MQILSEKYEEERLLKKLKRRLDERRYIHTLGVAYTAAAMMMSHGNAGDGEEMQHQIAQAYTAGLLHDCAKCLTDEDRDRYCKKYDVELTKVEMENPYLIHAKLGAAMAREKYGVTDPEILSAIRWHTTGHENMTLLEAIVFSADFIEPNRKPLLCLPEVRSVIYKDLNAGIYLILKQTLIHLDNRKQPIDEHTKAAFDWYEAHYGKEYECDFKSKEV